VTQPSESRAESEPSQERVGYLLRQATAAAADASRLQLDVLLNELIERASDVLLTQGRLRKLLDAVVAISGDLSLSSMLHRIVSAACELVDARYGALGVLAADGGSLSNFITVGLSPEEIAAIGPLPSGRGILGALIDDPQPLCLSDLSSDPRSYGFPANHPPMSTFLGVPVRTRNQVFGNLYLTEKQGGKDFTEEDEHLVIALASAAGVAIQNAKLYDAQRRRGLWLAAGSEIRNAALNGRDVDELAERVVLEAREASRAAFTALVLPAGDGDLTIRSSTEPSLRGYTFRAEGSVSGEVIATGVSQLVDGVDRGHAATPVLDRVRAETGACLICPLGIGDDEGGGIGALIVAFPRDSSDLAEIDRDYIAGFAGQVGVSLQLAASQLDRERLAVLEDRDRIARDLHDLVIQRLFAAGMTLQSTARRITDETVQARLAAVSDDLDDTIRELRQAIYQLQSTPGGDLRDEVQRMVEQAGEGSSASLRVHFSGPVDSMTRDRLRAQVLAVLREGVSNAVRHSEASTIDVTVAVDDTSLTATVQDDGRGIDAPVSRRSGLVNLATRAEEFGGELTVGPCERGPGTCVSWKVPL
jgi:signal transduction histidine kinase